MIIQNKELHKLLTDAGKCVEKVKKYTKEIEELDEKRNIEAIAHQKIKEKIMPIIEPYMKEVGEFEDIMGVEIELDENKNPTENINIKVIDRLDEFKRLFLEEKAKRSKKEEPKAEEPAKQ